MLKYTFRTVNSSKDDYIQNLTSICLALHTWVANVKIAANTNSRPWSKFRLMYQQKQHFKNTDHEIPQNL